MGRLELLRWRIFDRNYGFGERRMDLRFAKMTAALIANMPLRKGGSVKVEDFLIAEIGEDQRLRDLSAARFDAEARGRTP